MIRAAAPAAASAMSHGRRSSFGIAANATPRARARHRPRGRRVSTARDVRQTEPADPRVRLAADRKCVPRGDDRGSARPYVDAMAAITDLALRHRKLVVLAWIALAVA